jgi:hypothetical protein
VGAPGVEGDGLEVEFVAGLQPERRQVEGTSEAELGRSGQGPSGQDLGLFPESHSFPGATGDGQDEPNLGHPVVVVGEDFDRHRGEVRGGGEGKCGRPRGISRSGAGGVSRRTWSAWSVGSVTRGPSSGRIEIR